MGTGMSMGFFVALATIWWSLRKLKKQTARELLAGESQHAALLVCWYLRALMSPPTRPARGPCVHLQ